jgi:hypothetical protein
MATNVEEKPHREDLFRVQCNVGYRQATGRDVICPITLRIGEVKSEIILARGGDSKQNQRQRALTVLQRHHRYPAG